MSANLLELDDLKSYLGISDTSQDTILQNCLNASWAMMERITGRELSQATYTETKYWKPFKRRYTIITDNAPIIEVTSVKLDDTTVEDDYYLIDEEAGIIRFKFDAEFEKSEVQYKAGWYTLTATETPRIPMDLYWAGIKLAAWEFYKKKGRLGVKSVTGMNESITVYDDFDLQQIIGVIEAYRRIRVD